MAEQTSRVDAVAQVTWARLQAQVAQWERTAAVFGCTPELQGLNAVPEQDVINHYRRAAELERTGEYAEYRVQVDVEPTLAGGETALVAAFDAKLAQRKRTAGVRALKSKYGKETAERIIEKHTGRKYNLK
jgi:hypothetical protein